jgi:hypothetical protein
LFDALPRAAARARARAEIIESDSAISVAKVPCLTLFARRRLKYFQRDKPHAPTRINEYPQRAQKV